MRLKNSVRMAIEMIIAMDEEVKRGHLTLAEAQEKVKVHLIGAKQSDGKRPINKNIDLGEHGYMMVYDKKGTFLAHPNLEQKNFWEEKDKKTGNLFVQETIQKAANGGGFVYYYWNLPNDPNEFAPKVIYGQEDGRWGWTVVAGSYLDDYVGAATRNLYLLIGFVAAAMVVGAVIVMWLSRQISLPIEKVVLEMEEVASGRLNRPPMGARTNDEVGSLIRHFNHMVENLRAIIRQVEQTTTGVTDTSIRLTQQSGTVDNVAARIHRSVKETGADIDAQLKSLEETSHSMEEVAAGIQHIAQTSSEVSSSSVETEKELKRGFGLLKETEKQMQTINESTSRSATVVKQLGMRSNEIGKIVEVITEIASQTNLLALNAAIEAARAGGSGRGFAVVADEVRVLAEQSKNAAGQISKLITSIQGDTQDAIEAMSSVSCEVDSGMRAIEETGHVFETILDSVHQTTNRIQDFLSTSEQIAAGAEEVSAAVSEVQQIARNSAERSRTMTSITEEELTNIRQMITSSTQLLAQAASELDHTIQTFKL